MRGTVPAGNEAHSLGCRLIPSAVRVRVRSGLIGEDPQGMPNNLMPYVQQVAVGRRPHLTVHGNDYDTVDGTGVRDYIHVVDLAAGHLKALEWQDSADAGCEVFNLGTGTGISVLQMVEAMKKASGRDIPVEIGPRRPGDLATVYANPVKVSASRRLQLPRARQHHCSAHSLTRAAQAKEVLGWEAKYGVEEMTRDAWKWQSENPYGFGSAEDAE